MKPGEWIVLGGTILLVGVLFHLIPRYQKRGVYFGVTVTPAFRESGEGRAIALQFRVLAWIGTALSLVLSWMAAQSRQAQLFGLAPLVQVAVVSVAWVRAWRRTRAHTSAADGVRVAELFPAPEGLPGGPLAVVFPFLGPAGAAAYLWSRYDELPARYPAHWNAAGEVNRWVDKSPSAVFLAPAIATGVLLLLLSLALMICYGSRRGSSGERAGWATRYRRLNVWLLVTLMWMISTMISAISLGPLLPARTIAWTMWSLTGGILLVVIGFTIPLIRMSMEPTGGSDPTPDECWRFGAFYYNPDDPALMVERRDGPGFTLNFGNRLSWGLVGLLLLLVFGGLFLAIRLK